MFTGHEFADGAPAIIKTLQQTNTKASFFFTGAFLENKAFKKYIQQLKNNGHYIGPHSDQHLLYCDWNNRDSLLVTKETFMYDIQNNYKKLATFGIAKSQAHLFLPPYEWYNDTIAIWAKQFGLQLINFTPGTLSNADYTTSDMKNYRSSEVIMQSIKDYERRNGSGLNGFILLLHIGTDPLRMDKMYMRLGELVNYCKERGYSFVRVDDLLRL